MIDADELPPGWAMTTLGELCELNPKHPDTLCDDSLVSFVPMAAVSDETGTIVAAEIRPYGEVKKGYTHFANGDVIFAKITPCMENGKAASVRNLPHGFACGTTEFFVFRSQGAIDQDYLFHFIRQESYRKAARATMQSGVGQARVPKEFVLSTQIPLPPLNEQRRIVARIEELQARSRKAREALAAIPTLLEQFRQSVLASAFRGDLTASWRERHPDTEPASALLARIRDERRRQWQDKHPGKKYVEPEPVDTSNLPDLPEGWCWATFEELTENFDGKRVPVKRDDRKGKQGPYPYYGASGVIDHVDEYLFDGSYLLVAEDGANLLSRSSPIAFQAHQQFWVNNHAHIVQPRGEIPLAYLEGYFNGIDLRSFVTGTAQPKLTQAALNEIPVALAPLEEQAKVVALITRAQETVTIVLARSAKLLADHDSLDQSILAQAFRGELVEQDPTDEPASVLLERIRAERATEAPRRRSRRKESS